MGDQALRKRFLTASRPALALLLLAVAALSIGCRGTTKPMIQPTPNPWQGEQHCWWAAFRTELPSDTVAARFAHAFERIGLEGVAWSQLGDTAWAQSHPTILTGPDRIGTYSSRVVAFRAADTTFFRTFTLIVPSARAAGAENNNGAKSIPLCSEIARLAQVPAVAPAGPGRDDSLPRWRPRPYTTPSLALESAVDSIVLERTLCFGTCPAYRLRLAGTGHVVFESRNPQDSGRMAADTIPPATILTLLHEAETLGFFELPDVIADDRQLCPDRATDHETVTVTIYQAAGIKRVKDYHGCYARSDHSVVPVIGQLRAFETAIDSAANSARWVRPASRR